MSAKLRPLKKYNKKNALKLNNFNNYKPGAGKIITDLSLLGTDFSGIFIAKTKQHFLKAQKSNKALIYHKGNGLLYYNQNGPKRKFGLGGVIAKFNKKTKLSTSDFNFKSTSLDADYSLSLSSSTVKENHNCRISIKYTNVSPGTTLYGSISGIKAADISGSLNTSFKAKRAGKTALTIQAIADQLTEGSESFIFKLYSDKQRKNLVAKSERITIKDTSKSPVQSSYAVSISSSNAEEGESIRASLKTTNVKPGTILYDEITGFSSSDIDRPLKDKLTIKANGSASVSIGTIADKLTEGDESFIYKLYSDKERKNLITESESITVKDTSKSPQDEYNYVEDRSIFKDGSSAGDLEATEEYDYLKFSTNADSLVSFSISSNSNSLYPQIAIFDESGNQIAKNSSYNNSSASIDLTSLDAGGIFYLKVSSQVSGRSGSYDITSQLTSVDQLKNDVIHLTNIEREKSNLPPLKHDDALEKAAQLHVEDMNSSGRYLAHTGSNGSSPGDRIKAAGYTAAWHDLGNGSMRYVSQENAAAGQTSAAEVVNGWMNSAGHRAAIMDPHTEEIGVGFEIDDVSGRTYWIQTFGIPWSPGDNKYF